MRVFPGLAGPGLVLVLLAPLLLSATLVAQSNDLAARSRQASQLMKDRRFDEAAAIYRELVAKLPDEAGLSMNLGMALAMGGHDAEAIAPLQRAVRLQPSLLPAHLFLGSSLLALDRPNDAVPHLSRVVTARPDDMQSRGLLGRALLEASRPDEAVVQLRKLIAFSPREPRAWYDLGQSYNAIVQASLASFNSREDEAPWRTLLLGDALAGDGRLGAAFRLYREVQDQIAGTRAVHEALVRVYEKSGHADWAATERSLSAGVTVDCGRVPAECAFAAGQHEQALDASAGRTDPASRYWRVRSATELALAAFAELERLPDSRERREMRAEFARAHGKPLDAVKEIEAALAFAPDDPVLLGGLALSYQQARDYDRAIEVARRLLIRAPNDAAMLALCGQSLLELQRIDEAVPMLERAVKLAPEPETRAALGRAYVQKGQFAAAIPLIEPALPADADGTLHFQLARAYQGAGQGEKARPLLQKYQALQQARRERDAESADTAIVAPVRR